MIEKHGAGITSIQGSLEEGSGWKAMKLICVLWQPTA
jgi:hypothetical protein